MLQYTESCTSLPFDGFPNAWDFDSYRDAFMKETPRYLMSVMSRQSIEEDAEEASHLQDGQL